MTNVGPTGSWHPVAGVHELVPGHVFQGTLLGHELAIWRAEDGHVNVWEDRCLHRGLRLSLGATDGRELQCRYHGWRYASRTGGCTYIPAHPAESPSRTVCNRVYPAVISDAMVWTSTDAVPGTTPPGSDQQQSSLLRPIEFAAEADAVRSALARHRFAPASEIEHATPEMIVEKEDAHQITLSSSTTRSCTTVDFHIQPVDEATSIVRGVVRQEVTAANRRTYSAGLSALRTSVTAAARGVTPAIESESVPVAVAQRSRTSVVVKRADMVATDVLRIELVAADGRLPTAQPGAHIDLHLPNGITRQYSLVNAAGEQDQFTIGVKREPDSQGGSEYVHTKLSVGDELDVSGPHHNFALRRDAVRTLLIAGGIGITPLLSMARTLQRSGLHYEFHVFARSDGHIPFPDELGHLGDQVTTHIGLTPDGTAAELASLLDDPGEATHLYVCGPAPVIETTLELAAACGWPDSAVHFEYFGNPNQVDTSSVFEIALARSARTLHVGAGQTILEVLRSNGVTVPSSCEQGACGTCTVDVIEGNVDHQDVYLSATERRAGGRVVTCVSRSHSPQLVLDI